MPQPKTKNIQNAPASPLKCARRIQWQKMKDKEIVEAAIQRIAEQGIKGRNEFQTAFRQHYNVLCSRSLLDRIGLNESRRGSWRLMSDNEVLLLARAQIKEGKLKRKTDFKTRHSRTYKEVRKRGILAKLNFKPQSRDWSLLTDGQVVREGNRFLKKKGISGKKEMQDNGGWGIYGELRRRGLLDKVDFEEKHCSWASMANEKLLAHAQEQIKALKIKARGKFREKLGKVYDAVSSRGLLDSLHFEQRQNDWVSMSDSEMLQLARKHIKGEKISSRTGFQNKHPLEYGVLLKRQLLNKTGLPCPRRNQWEKMGDKQLVAFARKYCKKHQLFSWAELRKHYPSFCRTLAARLPPESRFEEIGLIGPNDWQCLSEAELFDYVRRYVERDGTQTFAEFKKCNRFLLAELAKRRLIMHSGLITKKTGPIVRTSDLEQWQGTRERIRGKLIKALDAGSLWELKRFAKLNFPDEQKRELLEEVDEKGRTPLMRAVLREDSAIIKGLLACRVAVEQRTPDKETAFMLAMEEEHLDAARLLLDAGADINAADDLGWTSLMGCAVKGIENSVDFLLAHGADTEIADEDGLQAKDFAMERGHLQLAKKIGNAKKPTGQKTPHTPPHGLVPDQKIPALIKNIQKSLGHVPLKRAGNAP